jgi:hypothetical protein
MLETDMDAVFAKGLHQFLARFIADSSALDGAIAAQFRFG